MFNSKGIVLAVKNEIKIGCSQYKMLERMSLETTRLALTVG